ncbi:MAG: hypothetical protein SHS37scaffold296_6 [Burkholderiales phage 68_11]|jgi:hypothetical protein|nr:MAG: hypothetical protein SHS37scaffold296_6 [Burkholderiales phage 68_11]
MNPIYIVQPGHQIRRPDGSLAEAGAEVEVADEVARDNPHALKLKAADEAAVQTPEQPNE